MNSGNQNESLLSSWKEIAAYLKCGVRSCIRWEKNNGLPVHRSGEPQHSRVYAYREELDAWLKARLNAPEVLQKRALRLRTWSRIALLTLVIAATVFAILSALKAQKGPRPFRLAKLNLATAEPDGQGRLRVWGNRSPQSYVNIWDIATSPKNTVKHSSLAVGDIDGDGKSELVAPTYAKVGFTRGEKQSVYFKIFLNLYKQGHRGLWKTTFYNDGDCGWEERIFWTNQVILANLDEDPANEIVLRTATWLGVYDYRPESGELKLISVINAFLTDKRLLLKSVAAANLDGVAPDEIIVSGNAMDPSGTRNFIRESYIFIVKMDGHTPRIIKTIPIDAILAKNSLCAGDVDHDGRMEIYTVGTRPVGTKYQAFLFGWNPAGDKIVDFAIPDSESDQALEPALAVSDLTFEAGDDLIVGVRPNKLFLFRWQDGGLTLKKHYSLDTAKVSLTALEAGDADGDGQKEVVVGGVASPEDEKLGHFYLEVLGFKSAETTFYPKWRRVGGENGETEVWAVAIGRK